MRLDNNERDRFGSFWIVLGRFGFVVGRCGSLWIVLDRFGSFWVVLGRFG